MLDDAWSSEPLNVCPSTVIFPSEGSSRQWVNTGVSALNWCFCLYAHGNKRCKKHTSRKLCSKAPFVPYFFRSGEQSHSTQMTVQAYTGSTVTDFTGKTNTPRHQPAHSGLTIYPCSVSEKMDYILMGINKGDWPRSVFHPFVCLFVIIILLASVGGPWSTCSLQSGC